jgi:hypothetical protein
MVEIGDRVHFEGKIKKVFGIHHNGNILLKMNGNLVQVFPEKIKKTK